MNIQRNHIVVFEHQSLKLNQEIEGIRFDKNMLKSLQSFYGEKGVPFFTLIHDGIRFNEHVGVIQIGNTVIEVLPKADSRNTGIDAKTQWRDILIKMLSEVGLFEIHALSSSSLKLKYNSILDLYFELFIKEVQFLLHKGVVKKYRKNESNTNTLKGNLLFNKHIQFNLTHQERFYVRHTIYDAMHLLHCILYKTICLLKKINTNEVLNSRIGSLLLDFPEMPDIAISESVFNKIIYNRKTESYHKSIEIARLLLLKYHPDISSGRNDVLALMFDMNKLWEQFVYVSLKKHKSLNTSITAQTCKSFWELQTGSKSRIRPDIVINKNQENCFVLDTKWKNLNGYMPSPEDLRQMYVYHEYYRAKRVALVYPGTKSLKSSGTYLNPSSGKKSDKECHVVTISVNPLVKQWQKGIFNEFENWLSSPTV